MLVVEPEAEVVKVAVLKGLEELLVESEAELVTFELLGSLEMLFAEFEVELVKVASMRSLEELVALLNSLGTGLELQAAAPGVEAARSERQYLREFLLEATLEVDLTQLVAEPAAVVVGAAGVAPHYRLVAAGDMGFAGLVVECIVCMCEDIYASIPSHCKEPSGDYTRLIRPLRDHL